MPTPPVTPIATIDLFAGAGGLSLGAQAAGADVRLAVKRQNRVTEDTHWSPMHLGLTNTCLVMHGIAMPTHLFPKLLERAVDQHGLLTPDDARAIGATENALRRLAHEGVIARVGFAVYQVPQLAGDPLAQYQEALLWLRAPAALTHDTALDLHHLCDINPGKVHVTVDIRNRPRRTAPAWIQIHFGALPDADLTWLEGLRIATPTRAILDAIATNIGQQFIDQAIETGRQRGLLTEHDLRRIEMAQLRQRLQILERLDQGA